ncbi:MAG: hypothetical protein FWG98_03455 [Candidatus Cloacimonetes bacterium]|nr:hypothetical protein [Candidatus Cloacimonadota bacterium]
MDYLLDTHTLIWVLDENIISFKVPHEIIKNPKIQKSVSIVSIWEIIIKISINKLNLNFTIDDLLETNYIKAKKEQVVIIICLLMSTILSQYVIPALSFLTERKKENNDSTIT